MATYIVKTNKVGGKGDKWRGQVAYRMEYINKAWRQHKDLECFCGEEEPKRMIIPVQYLFDRILHREKFVGSEKYGTYELAYYYWVPTHVNGQPIPIEAPQQREPVPNQKALF